MSTKLIILNDSVVMKMDLIKENLKVIHDQIIQNAQQSRIAAKNIQLVAVTKTVGIDEIQEIVKAGTIHLGESRVQDMMQKMDQLPKDLQWHFIGHLQTNKVKYIVGKCRLIHSVDSVKLALKIDEEAAKVNVLQDILLEINVSGEKSKFGIDAEDLEDVCRELQYLHNTRVLGLMTMAPYTDDEDVIRLCFRKLRQLYETVGDRFGPAITMKHLSMGMTNDYHIAVQEGATLLRVGSAIFQNGKG